METPPDRVSFIFLHKTCISVASLSLSYSLFSKWHSSLGRAVTDLQRIDIFDRCCACVCVCVCVWGQECVGRRLADKTKLEWNTELGIWIIDRPLHVNAYTHAVKCKVQKHHSVWGCLKATWSVNISLITSHISSCVFHSWRRHICFSVLSFYLSSSLSLISLLLPHSIPLKSKGTTVLTSDGGSFSE